MNVSYLARMDKFRNNITEEIVLAVQWDGSKEHGERIAAVIDMDVRYDLTDGKFTMHIGGYDNMVANDFDFVGVNSDGAFTLPYERFMQLHVMIKEPSNSPTKKINPSFDEVVAPLIEWLKRNEDKESDYRVIVDSLGAELLSVDYANYKSK